MGGMPYMGGMEPMGGVEAPEPEGPEAILADLEGQVEDIFANQCSNGFCHNVDQIQPRLVSEGVASVVGVTPSNPEITADYVTAGSPDQSYLWHKINGTQEDVGDAFGAPMPKVGALTELEIDTIRRWIYALDGVIVEPEVTPEPVDGPLGGIDDAPGPGGLDIPALPIAGTEEGDLPMDPEAGTQTPDPNPPMDPEPVTAGMDEETPEPAGDDTPPPMDDEPAPSAGEDTMPTPSDEEPETGGSADAPAPTGGMPEMGEVDPNPMPLDPPALDDTRSDDGGGDAGTSTEEEAEMPEPTKASSGGGCRVVLGKGPSSTWLFALLGLGLILRRRKV